MAQMTLTRDFWQAAQRQVNKIKPEQSRIVENQRKQPSKSLQLIFKEAQGNISSFLPKASVKSTITSSNVPQSIKLLDLYSQRLGYLPMGKIYEKTGNKYLGRTQQINQKGQKFYKAFPKTDSVYFDTPNLTQNFSYRANRAIEKWNDYVSAQSDLAEFIDRARTPQGRKKMIFQFAKGSSQYSSYYKVLASLYFMYVQLKSSTYNPLHLSQDSTLRLKEALTTPGDLDSVYNSVMMILKNDQTKNSALFRRINEYSKYKRASLKASLKKQQYEEIQPLLAQKMATIPPQMISTPEVQDTQWFQILQKQGLSKSLVQGSLMTSKWNPKQKWFKTMNYLI